MAKENKKAKGNETPLFNEHVKNLATLCKKEFKFVDENGKTHIDTDQLARFLHIKLNTISVPTDDGSSLFYYWNGKYFQLGADNLIKSILKRAFESSANRGMKSEIVASVIDYSLWDYEDRLVDKHYFEERNPRFINLKNGILDIETNKFYKHNPYFKMTYMIPVDYNPKADDTFFKKFVSELMETEAEQKVIQEIFGYCLYADYFIQKCFAFIGTGANGKDTLLYPLCKMLGKENVSSVNMVQLTNNRFAPANLHNKMANISNETPTGKLSSTDLIKGLRGGSSIHAEHKNMPQFNFINFAKLIFSANQLPQKTDDTYAWKRSWIIIQFKKVFSGKDADKRLKYKLTDSEEKMSAILNYALVGLKRLLKNQAFTFTIDEDAMDDIWNRSSNTVKSFISDCIIEQTDKTIDTTDILTAYYDYCEKYNVEAGKRRAFWMKWNKILKDENWNAKRKQYNDKSGYYWEGIRFRSKEDELDDLWEDDDV